MKKTIKWLTILLVGLILILSGYYSIEVPRMEMTNPFTFLTSKTQTNENTPNIKPEWQNKSNYNEIKIKPSRNHKSSSPINHHQTKEMAIEVIATGYTAGIESTGKTPRHPAYGITYSGIQAVRDKSSISTIAADPQVFPLGTILYIPDYGYGVVADTGSAIKGEKIDLFFDTKDQVYQQWGKRKLHVYVIKRGNGEITEQLWNQIKREFKSPIHPNFENGLH